MESNIPLNSSREEEKKGDQSIEDRKEALLRN